MGWDIRILEPTPITKLSKEARAMIASGALKYRPASPLYQIVFVLDDDDDAPVSVHATTTDHEDAIERLAKLMEEEGEVDLNGTEKTRHGGPYMARFTVRWQVSLNAGPGGRSKWRTETITIGPVSSKNLPDMRAYVIRHVNEKYPCYEKDESGDWSVKFRSHIPKGTKIWTV